MWVSRFYHAVISWALVTASAGRQHNHRRLTPNYEDNGEHHRNMEVNLPTSPQDHLVTDLPLLQDAQNLQQYAGLLPASANQDKYFFYWYFLADTSNIDNNMVIDDDIPLVIWLNGGPACSSMDGLFIEHGPLEFQVNEMTQQYELKLRESSWHKSPAYIVYVDQPVGTGLSFTTSRKYPRNDEEVNIDFYYWLQQFLQLHSDTLLTADGTSLRRPLYFTGESHAGHYIPSMMAYIERQNQDATGTAGNLRIPLAGAAIGNGNVDPYHQYAGATAAYGHGLIDRAQQAALDQKEIKCQQQLDKGVYVSSVCFDLIDDIVAQSHGASGTTKVSQYDVRQEEPKNAPRIFPPGHKVIETYLGGHALPIGDATGGTMQSDYLTVLKAIHAYSSHEAGQRYQECTDPPYDALAHQDGLGVTKELTLLLNNNIRFLFFNGIYDLVCNHVGNEIMIENLIHWKNRDAWIEAPRSAWLSSTTKKVAGYMKKHANLSFLKVLDSGHMVPLDQPEVAFEMIQKWMYELKSSSPFASSAQDLKRAIPPSCEATCSPGGACQRSASSRTSNGGAFEFAIAHSWMAGLLTMGVFLIYCILIRKQQQQQVPLGDTVGMELMLAGSSRAYRDTPP
mmetsp:Transcript_6476/g.9922  ORF Transcript_6476/g.9922 Transcript_6476/m.9922 type:complete len:621 (-) Transcript_6476:37-1899(-)